MCDGGVATWNRSSGPRPSATTQCSVPRPMDRCVWRTAFGRSVVPELKTRTQSSLSRTVGAGRGAGLFGFIVPDARASSRSRTRSAPRQSDSTGTAGPSATP